VTFPAATREDHEKFCRIGGWQLVRTARGKTGTHHVTFELELSDGRVLRTRISHPPNRTAYGPRLWAHILRDQLQASAEEFWACVRSKTPPVREQTRQEGEGVPADIVYRLVVRWRIPEDEVASMTRQEAIDRLHTLWSEQGGPTDPEQ
jgi:hypothetical protein